MKIRALAACTALAAGLALSSTASAQFGFDTNQPGTFVDITSTGTALGQGDDATFDFAVPANCANAAFPAGTIRICTNGHAGYGNADTQYSNAALPTTFAYSGNVACVCWDDLRAAADGHNGQVYAEVQGNVLIIQWNEMDHYFTSPNSITFELKIFGNNSGPGGAAAQYIYRNMDTGDDNANGASATIGYQLSPGSATQYAFNQAGSVQAGTVLSLMQTGTFGACCSTDGTCSLTTQSLCTGAGGVYRGDNTTCAAANCPQPPVTNGSFETGDLTGWTQFGDTSFTSVSNTAAHTGQWGFRAGPTDAAGGGIQQTITAPAGAQLDVSFWLRDEDIETPNSFTFALDNQTLLSLVDDTTHGDWTQHTYHITLQNANPTLQITCYNSPSWWHLDDVRVSITNQQACYANCDGSTIAPILNVNDFICFQTKYAAGDSYANCDGSTIAPILNVNDFICFQTKYAAGCP